MLTENLFNQILIEPYSADGIVKEIYIVSGYASATFANRHLFGVPNASVNLIIGMPGARSDHSGYENLINQYRDNFNAYYLNGSPPVHSKMYAWFVDGEPLIGFAGSGNYSQPGFFHESQMNQFSREDPVKIKEYFNSLLVRSTRVQDIEPPEFIRNLVHAPQGSIPPGTIFWETNKRVRISFLARSGELPIRSGLNWGQREGREPNQAYLSLKSDARQEHFLPPLAFTFTLITDDGYSFDSVVAQEGRKAIHSTHDNSELGKYFRNRLNVALGELVTIEHLIAYGRTDYTLEKINDETFMLDFSV